MAQRMSFMVPNTGFVFSTGTWTQTDVSGVHKQRKTAADNAPVVRFFVCPPPETPYPHERQVKKIHLPYTIATAALDAAPTAVVRKVSLNGTTRVLDDATVTETEAISGTAALGTAVGDYLLTITLTTPQRLEDHEYLQVEVTFDAAATTVLDLGHAFAELA